MTTGPRLVRFGDVAVHRIDPSLWTVIIPAAGRGSRLGSAQPKVLYPVGGRPILDHLLGLFAEVCRRFVIVVSPAGRRSIAPLLPGRAGVHGIDLALVVQQEPTGMAAAVQLGLEVVRTPYSVVVWGDQILLRRRTTRACLSAHEAALGRCSLTMLTARVETPYINICRDAAGRMTGVEQAREGEIRSSVGENDCGFFCFTTAALDGVLRSGATRQRGSKTGEFNLLPLLPDFEAVGDGIQTVTTDDVSECRGINTPEDVRIAEEVLQSRRRDEVASQGA